MALRNQPDRAFGRFPDDDPAADIARPGIPLAPAGTCG